MDKKINIVVWPWFAFSVKDFPEREEVEVTLYPDLGYARSSKGKCEEWIS